MVIALIGALAIGLSLGLLGSGGSILTVPVLVLVLGRPEKIAIAESLGIVGGIALAGAIPYGLRGQMRMHGTEARMRVSSVILPASSCGTLRSARMNTRWPRTWPERTKSEKRRTFMATL
jgi:uncharacterized membrane protein YfcA